MSRKRESKKVVDNTDELALIEAAKQGNIEEINRLIKEKKVNVNPADEGGLTAIIIAAENGHHQVIDAL